MPLYLMHLLFFKKLGSVSSSTHIYDFHVLNRTGEALRTEDMAGRAVSGV